MFTNKESKILRFLMTSFEAHSINDIAKDLEISPNGTYKILKKLEKQKILIFKEISNIKSYSIDFQNELILSYLEIALIDERNNQPKIKVRKDDLKPLEKICKACILFGSYVRDKEKPRDLDILFIFDKDKYDLFHKNLEEVQEISPLKMHDVVQTPEDLINNLIIKDEVIIDIIRKGVVLWGNELIARSVKNVQTR